MKAKCEEKAAPYSEEKAFLHYDQVNAALKQYEIEYDQSRDTGIAQRRDLDRISQEANNFLRKIKQISSDTKLKEWCDILAAYINEGVYARLPRELKTLSRQYKGGDRIKMKTEEYEIQKKIGALIKEYQSSQEGDDKVTTLEIPQIIISETFI